MRRGIFGGTFDPVHNAHLVAAEAVRAQLGLDQVVFVPAGRPPHKLNNVITPAEHRLAIVQLAIAGQPHFALSRVDMDRAGPSYTVDTVQLLREAWGPQVEVWFIMGADSLHGILTWRQPERLIQLCRLAVVRRPGYNADSLRLEARLPGLSKRVDWVDMPLLDISSTDLQRRVREGRSIKHLVPEAVEAYIKEHGLYRTLDRGDVEV